MGEARTTAKAARDEQIAELAAEGKTQREIAEAVGCDHKTVGNRLAGEKRNSSEIPQDPKPTPPSPKPMATTTANRKPAAERVEEIRQLVNTGHPTHGRNDC